MVHSIDELEDVFGFKAVDVEAIECLRQHDMHCFIASRGNVLTSMYLDGVIDSCNSRDISLRDFKYKITQYMSVCGFPHAISKERSTLGQVWILAKDWKQ